MQDIYYTHDLTWEHEHIWNAELFKRKITSIITNISSESQKLIEKFLVIKTNLLMCWRTAEVRPAFSGYYFMGSVFEDVCLSFFPYVRLVSDDSFCHMIQLKC